MTSILTNISAQAALQSLRVISASLSSTQNQVSSGLRVANATDNAAYWSISTTMRSDNMAISAVSDALALGSAKVDTAYAGMESVIDVLHAFQAKLVTAREESVDKSKIQTELDQLKDQVKSIAESASFNGQNWLNTDIEDIYDHDLNKTHLASSFVRTDSGVSVKMTEFNLSEVSLFNSTGGGILERDRRDTKTIGGMRIFSPGAAGADATAYNGSEGSGWMYPPGNSGIPAFFALAGFPDGSPLDFNAPGAQISFDIILDKDNPDPAELPGPYYPGHSRTITITKATIDAVLPGLGGVISTNTQFATVLNSVLGPEGATVNANYVMPDGSGGWIHDPRAMTIHTHESHGDGSYVEIANLTSSVVSNGGLSEAANYGSRGSGMVLDFKEFIVYEDGDDKNGVKISFRFSINNAPATFHTFDRAYVNSLLSKENGKVETADEMVTLLKSLLDNDWDLVIEAQSPSSILIKSDPAVDRTWGSGTGISFSNIRVSIEPAGILNFVDIDIEQNPEMLTTYIQYIEQVTGKAVDGAASLGALKTRLDMQSNFASRLADTIDRGVGRLVDTDMNEASTRLKALQTQQQLAVSSLQIANSAPETLLQLFR